MRKILTVTVFAAIFACSCVFGDPSPRNELRQDCKLYDAPSTYEGKMVTIRAVYGSSPFDGAYLLDERCHIAMWFTTPAEHKTFALISGSSYPKVKEPTFNVIEDSEYERFNRFLLQQA